MLNFDPHRWIAEREAAFPPQTVATLATVAGRRAQNEKSKPEQPAATVATPAALSVRDPSVTLREWHSHLAPLDANHAPDGIPHNRWRQLHGDSWWIYENFAGQAVRHGWSAHDLFGVFIPHPGWGGLCDRLHGARNLKMAGPKAVWSRMGVPDWTCAGAGDSLVSYGLKLIWELQDVRARQWAPSIPILARPALLATCSGCASVISN